MIDTALLLFFAGVALIGFALHVNTRGKADGWNSIALLIIGAILLAVALLLLVGYGLYRAFSG